MHLTMYNNNNRGLCTTQRIICNVNMSQYNAKTAAPNSNLSLCTNRRIIYNPNLSRYNAHLIARNSNLSLHTGSPVAYIVNLSHCITTPTAVTERPGRFLCVPAITCLLSLL